ncbi:MAG TPA: hypothetical protein PKA17_08235 [Phenylobacterium sp.]|nr:hypothetical protein [Phenylobacterium sp.]
MPRPARMTPLSLRPLTPGEAALGGGVFGQGLSPGPVRLLALPLWRRAFAAGPRLLVFPDALALADFSTAPLPLQGLFVHELTHVWQAQNGIGLLRAKLRAGDGPSAYAYDLCDGRGFCELNIEQQAMIVQHAFLASRGQACPHPALSYGAYLAGLAPTGRHKPWKV